MKRLLSLCTLALLALPAQAHDDATLDRMKSPHGGQVRMAGAWHFELVLGQDQVTVHLTDHADKPMPAKGAKGTATLLTAAGKVSVPLAPAGDSRLEGRARFTRDPSLKAVVSITFPDGQTQQARFEPAKALGATPQP